MSSKMILPTFFGFIKSQLQFHDILKKCFFTNINSKTEMIREKTLIVCFSGTGASCQMIIFFLSKDNFNMKIEYSRLEIKQ